uniref:CDK5RAP1-like protein n=1 Tax=Timema poppense TaxID=170557 RepID=A0A7R9D3H3_TIMPO|nr:unnamed protein product [Timema poppensis]
MKLKYKLNKLFCYCTQIYTRKYYTLNKNIVHNGFKPFPFKHNINNYDLPPCRFSQESVSAVKTLQSSSSTTTNPMKKYNINHGPGLKDFLQGSSHYLEDPLQESYNVEVPYIETNCLQGMNRKVYFDVYGCQMNVNDTEVVWSILKNVGYTRTMSMEDADIVLVVTCAIREGAESKVWNKLQMLKGLKKKRTQNKCNTPMKIGVLGCMAERLKHQLIEKEQAVDLVAGPDSYKDLPRLLAVTDNNQTAVNVLLSLDETYADILPVRLNQDSVTAFVSIMRGCDNMCTYCIVPFTRGRERSRPIDSILEEVRLLSQQGVKEITLLGQNVNSYRDLSNETHYGGLPADEETHLVKGFRTVYKRKKGGLRFTDLLDQVSQVDPNMRIRFTSPHPKDFPDEVLQLIQERANICRSLHLPAQSGSSAVLERMRRGYTREAYLDLVSHIRKWLPDVSLSSDFICGFCGETEQEYQETLSLIEQVGYDMAYLFSYSMREKTTAHRRFVDDVPLETKKLRHLKMTALYRREAEKPSKRSESNMAGRNDGNTKVILPAGEIPESSSSQVSRSVKPGDYVVVLVAFPRTTSPPPPPPPPPP